MDKEVVIRLILTVVGISLVITGTVICSIALYRRAIRNRERSDRFLDELGHFIAWERELATTQQEESGSDD
jgi:hypothetical protein